MVSDDQPYVIPVLYARNGEQIFVHGSPLSRLLSTLAKSMPVCLTVTLIDGLVLARSAFHHSLNYRSAVVFGEARVLRCQDEKLAALRTIVEHVIPGRSDEARGPSDQELKATEVVGLEIHEASAKVRTGGPVDAAEDHALPVWAGELPLRLTACEPMPDPDCAAPLPLYLRSYARVHG